MNEKELVSQANKHIVRSVREDWAPPILASGKGSLVKDVNGTEFIDFTSGQICAAVGHNHPKVIEAIEGACRDILHANTWRQTVDTINLAVKLASYLPDSLSKTIQLNTGAESTEVAIKMAKMYTGGFEILSFTAGFHGLTTGSGASTFSMGRSGYGPTVSGAYAMLTPYCYRCPLKLKPESCAFACLDLSFEMIDKQSVGALAATIVEPILSAGGIIDPPEGYFPKLKKMNEERGMLLIFDEAITGLGRLGSMFGFEELDTVPDILTLSKSFGGGIPLSTTTVSAEIEETIFDKGFLHATSHTADPLPARVGLAVLDIVAEEDLVPQAKEKGAYLKKRFEELAERYEIIGDVRGKGLLIGIELVRDRETKEAAGKEGASINQRCLDKGLLMNIVQLKGENSVFRIAPPLTCTYEEMDRAVAIIEEAIQEETHGSSTTEAVAPAQKNKVEEAV